MLDFHRCSGSKGLFIFYEKCSIAIQRYIDAENLDLEKIFKAFSDVFRVPVSILPILKVVCVGMYVPSPRY